MWRRHNAELIPLKKEKGDFKDDRDNTSIKTKSTPLHGYSNLFIEQTTKGWFQNLFGCDAPTEIHPRHATVTT